MQAPCEARLLLLRRLYPEEVDGADDCRNEERQLADNSILHMCQICSEVACYISTVERNAMYLNSGHTDCAHAFQNTDED